MSSLLVIIISIVIFILIIYFIAGTCPINENIDKEKFMQKDNKFIENWVDYQNMPYGNINSGLRKEFYDYPIYRKPYNYPVCNLVDYPIKHCRNQSY